MLVVDEPGVSPLRGNGGGAPGVRRWRIESLRLYFDDFALVRLSDAGAPATALATLFRIAGEWRIASELVAFAAHGARAARFSPQGAEPRILAELDRYYRAVEAGDAATLRSRFASDWAMKNFEGGAFVVEDRDTFLRRWVDGKPLPGYADDRQVASIELFWDRAALVCVDKPSGPVVACFTFMRDGAEWRMTDKAWSEARDA